MPHYTRDFLYTPNGYVFTEDEIFTLTNAFCHLQVLEELQGKTANGYRDVDIIAWTVSSIDLEDRDAMILYASTLHMEYVEPPKHLVMQIVDMLKLKTINRKPVHKFFNPDPITKLVTPHYGADWEDNFHD